MPFDAGSAAARYDLNIDGFRQSLAEIRQGYAELAQLQQGLKPPTPPKPAGGGGGGGDPAAKAEREARQLADSEVRVARATRDYQGALTLVNAELGRTQQGTTRYNQLLVQQAQITNQAERAGRSQLSQLLDVKGALVGIVGGYSVASIAATAYNEVIGRTKAGFELVATLEASRKSIDIQLGGLRNVSQVYQQAAVFGDRYKLTQEQLNEALVAAVPVMRRSVASTTDILGVFSRLTVLKPGKTIDDAARALGELQAGQIVSLEHQFNISATAANKMKQQIEGGADAVQVVAAYLDDAGVTMDALKVKTEGAAGAAADLAKASEQINIALGGIAASKGGLAIIDALAQAGRGLAGVLNGDVKGALANLATNLTDNSFGTEAATFGLGGLHTAYEKLVTASGPFATSFETVFQALVPVAYLAAKMPDDIHRLAVEMGLIAPAQQGAADGAQQQQQAQAGANEEITKAATVTFTAAGAYEAAATSGTRYATTGLYIASVSKESAVQALVDAKNKQIEADKTKILQEQTQLAADKFLRLNPQITVSGVEALVAAGKMNPLVAKLLEVEIQAGNTSRELAGLAAQEAGKIEARQEEIDTRRGGGRLTPDELKKKAQDDAANAAVADAKRRQAIADARRDQIEATGTTQQKLALAQGELAKLTEGTEAYIRKQTEVIRLTQQLAREREQNAKKGIKDASAQEKADLALLEPTERLVALRERLANLNPASVEYKKTLKDIRDLEGQIADEKERQVKSALDAQLAAIEDRKDRRKEEKELATARRVLASSSTSEEQKAAARDLLERIPLEQQKRALEIARQVREAGGTPVPTGQPLPSGPLRTPLPPAAAGLPPGIPALPTGAIPGGFSLNVQVLVDGKEVAAVIRSDLHGGVFSELRGGLAQAQSAGVARR